MPLVLCQGAPQQRQHISISAARSKSVWRIRSEVSLSWILPVETGSTVSLVVGTNQGGSTASVYTVHGRFLKRVETRQKRSEKVNYAFKDFQFFSSLLLTTYYYI